MPPARKSKARERRRTPTNATQLFVAEREWLGDPFFSPTPNPSAVFRTLSSELTDSARAIGTPLQRGLGCIEHPPLT
jgi:hypothetical protein